MTPDSLSQPLSWQIFVLIICVILLALITMTNTAMESVSRSKVRQMLENDENDSRARRLDRIINNPARYRSTNRLIGFLLTAGGTVQALALPYHPAVCVLLFILAALIFGEIFPRKFAKQHSLPAALRFRDHVRSLLQRHLSAVVYLALRSRVREQFGIHKRSRVNDHVCFFDLFFAAHCYKIRRPAARANDVYHT